MEAREKIVNACKEMAVLHGLKRITVEGLADRAGVSKKAVYRNFRGKEEIIETAVNTFIIDTVKAVERITETECSNQDMQNAVLEYLILNGGFIFNPLVLNDLRSHYPYLWKKIERFRTEVLRKVIGRMVRYREGLAPEIDPRIVTAAIMAAVTMVMTPDFILDNQIPFEEAATQLGKIFNNALCMNSV